jgi:[ribosomal protein S18]-alanine N-acetyltransferase
MRNAWKIRVAERRDVGELLGIEESQFPEPWTKRILMDEIENIETRRYTVAVEKKRIVGYLGVMFVLEELHVNTIGTLPQEEGRGIASSLLDEAWADAKERGIKRATLEVAVSNQRAIDLYYRYGFRPVGVRKNYYEKSNEDALILWADLSSEPPEPPPTLE